MTTRRVLAESLLYHWRSHLAVALCVATGTAVLTGALLVGDSMRGSLRELTFDQLGQVDYALQAGRYFGADLADRVREDFDGGWPDRFKTVVPAAVLRGSLAKTDESGRETARARGVQVLGVAGEFWALGRSAEQPVCPDDWGDADGGESVVLNDTVARELGVRPGDVVHLRVEQPSDVPREAVLGRKDDLVKTLPLTVARIVTRREMGRFKLTPGQQMPRNAYLPLDKLAKAIGQPGRANTLLVSDSLDRVSRDETLAAGVATVLEETLAEQLRLEDVGLRLRNDPTRGYVSLESSRMVLEPPLATAGLQAARDLNLRTAPTLAYLANAITRVPAAGTGDAMPPDGTQPSSTASSVVELPFALAGKLFAPFRQLADAARAREIPYSTVAALPVDAEPPFGPIPLVSGERVEQLSDDEILLNTWAAEDLGVGPGDWVALTYFLAEPAKPFDTAATRFRVRGVVKIEGPAADPGLVPKYPGITDKTSYRDWDPPFPIDLKKVRDKDEDYWKRYRTTPKAFVSLAAGERLWGSRFGKWTSIRLARGEEWRSGGVGEKSVKADGSPTPPLPHSSPVKAQPADSLEALRDQFAARLLARLRPEQMGLVFQPVKAQGLAAARGGTDFAGLFLAFSFFLIAAAVILIALVFRLGVERRAKQVGLLLAVGFDRARVGRLFVAEGLVVAVVGSLVGLFGAFGYAWAVIEALRSWWLPAVGTTLLELHVAPRSLLIGFAAGVFMAAGAIIWSLRGLTRLPPRELLAGSVTESLGRVRSAVRWARIVGWSAVVIAVVQTVVATIVEVSPATFFIAGSAILVACLSFLAVWLSAASSRPVRGHGLGAVMRLGARNGSRHRSRSVLTAGLVASATFVIVAVGLNRQTDREATSDKSSGNGGFALVAESDVPLLHDLNSPAGRAELGLQADAARWLDDVGVFRFRLRPGEDSSCLNLYRPTHPRILGAPPELIARGGFRFHGSLAESRDDRANPWRLLEKELPSGAVPAIGDANSVRWILHLGLGKQLAVTAEDGREVPLEIVATLDCSIFQSELVISESNFRGLFPNQSGYSYFLIEHSLPESRQGMTRDDERRPGGELQNGSESRLSAVGDRLPADRSGRSTLPDRRATIGTQLATFLEQQLSDFGFDVSSTAERLAEYHAVENTYLSTFQMLGGLGLMLGTLGLGTVMLRNVLERRGELALLLAVGYRPAELVWLVLSENAFLLVAGLGAGTLSALIAVAPHLLSQAGGVPWLSVGGTLALVLIVGLSAAAASVRATLRTPLLPALRAE